MSGKAGRSGCPRYHWPALGQAKSFPYETDSDLHRIRIAAHMYARMNGGKVQTERDEFDMVLVVRRVK